MRQAVCHSLCVWAFFLSTNWKTRKTKKNEKKGKKSDLHVNFPAHLSISWPLLFAHNYGSPKTELWPASREFNCVWARIYGHFWWQHNTQGQRLYFGVFCIFRLKISSSLHAEAVDNMLLAHFERYYDNFMANHFVYNFTAPRLWRRHVQIKTAHVGGTQSAANDYRFYMANYRLLSQASKPWVSI